jgi:lysophospholipase L1-like esterase
MRRLVFIAAVASAACSASVDAPGFGGTTSSTPADADPSSGDAPGADDAPPSGGDTVTTDDAPAPPELATIHYVGRFTGDNKFGWSGGGAVARFNGTGISVHIMGGPNLFAGYVDGALVKTFPQADNATVIADSLAPGDHTVEAYRRSEALFNPSIFMGFSVTGGDLVPSPYPFAHRMQFIGDSITCGYGDLGVNGTCSLDVNTESEMLTYAWLTAHALNAEPHVIAWSGKGMYRQYSDHDIPSPDQMPELYERTLPTMADSTWDHTRYVPDVIVINLGTNDWSTGDPGTAYEDAYVAFVTHLRTLYPAAEIFCTLGPMQTSAPALARVQDVVTTLADAHVHYLAFATQLESDGLGCDSHPSTTTHAKMATVLEQAVRDVTGW